LPGTSPFISILTATLGDFVADFLAGLSLHIFTTEIVEGKDHEKLTTNQNNWIFDNLRLIVIK